MRSPPCRCVVASEERPCGVLRCAVDSHAARFQVTVAEADGEEDDEEAAGIETVKVSGTMGRWRVPSDRGK